MFLILCPLPLELDHLLIALNADGPSALSKNVGPLQVYEARDKKWRLAVGGHGKTQFAIHTQFLIDHFKDTTAVICAGASGALTPSTHVGDTVVATKTIEHDYRLKFISRPDPEFLGHPCLLEMCRVKFKELKNIHFGPIASGDEDIIASDRADELYRQTKALAVAWEGVGGARACAFNNMPYLEIRTITDTADKNATHDFRKNIVTGMASLYKALSLIETIS
jgi:adenosylhomocysteine nucleosidase